MGWGVRLVRYGIGEMSVLQGKGLDSSIKVVGTLPQANLVEWGCFFVRVEWWLCVLVTSRAV